MTKVPKRADKAIQQLEKLADQLHYFYKGHPKFKKEVLKPAKEIENILSELAINKKETFKRIAKRYKDFYEKKQEALDSAVTNTNLNDSIRTKYRNYTEKDRT